MSILKKLAGQTMYYGLSSILGRFIGFLLMPLYAYSTIIDPKDMGQYTELMSYTGILLIFFTCRMESPYFRYGKIQNEEPQVFSNALLTVVSIATLLGITLMIGAPYVAQWLGYENGAIYIRILAIILTIDAFCEIPMSRLRFMGLAKRFASFRIINILVNVFLNVFFVLICPYLLSKEVNIISIWYDPNRILTYIFLANVLASTTQLLLLWPYFKGGNKLNVNLVKKMLHYAWPLIIVSAAAMFNEMFGRIILKWLLPGTIAENEATLGIYGMNVRLAMIIALFTQAFRYAAEPFFFQQSDKENSEKIYAQVAKYYLIFCIIGFLAVTLYIDIFRLFIGPKYYAGLGVVPILLLANIFSGMYFNISIWYRLKDKTSMGALIALMGSVFTITGNYLLIPVWGYAGAAWATLLCYLSMTVVCYFIGQRVMPVPYEIGRMILLLVVAVIFQQIYFYMRPIFEGNYALLLGIGSIFMVGFIGILWLLEKQNIKNIIARKR